MGQLYVIYRKAIKEFRLAIGNAKAEAMAELLDRAGCCGAFSIWVRMPPQGSHIPIREVQILVAPTMKYLGLILDNQWNFREHYARLVPRLMSGQFAVIVAQSRRTQCGQSSSLLVCGTVHGLIWGAHLGRPPDGAQLHTPDEIPESDGRRGDS